MPLSAAQKLGALCLPVGAIWLGILTSGPEWNPKGVQRSWRGRSLPSPTAAPAPAPPAEVEPPKPPEPGKKPRTTGRPKPATPVPPGETPPVAPTPPGPENPPPTPPPAPAEPAAIEFRVAGLAPAKSAAPLTVPMSMRLDLHITASNSVKLGSDLTDAESVKVEIRAGAPQKKSDGLLYLVPNLRAPWDTVRDLAAAGAATGWTNIACGVADPSNPGQGRVLRLDIPATEAPSKKGLDILRVVVTGGAAGTSSYTVNGEACATVEILAKKVQALHKEYEEGFEEGYSAEVDETPWLLEGTGAGAGGVIAALDALRSAGVKTVRIPGVVRK